MSKGGQLHRAQVVRTWVTGAPSPLVLQLRGGCVEPQPQFWLPRAAGEAPLGSTPLD